MLPEYEIIPAPNTKLHIDKKSHYSTHFFVHSNQLTFQDFSHVVIVLSAYLQNLSTENCCQYRKIV